MLFLAAAPGRLARGLFLLRRRRGTAAPAAALMDVLAVPRRVIVVRIQPPCQDETRSVLIAVLELVHRLADAVGELTILRIALGIVVGRSVIGRAGIRGVGRCGLLGVGPDARQRRQPLAF